VNTRFVYKNLKTVKPTEMVRIICLWCVAASPLVDANVSVVSSINGFVMFRARYTNAICLTETHLTFPYQSTNRFSVVMWTQVASGTYGTSLLRYNITLDDYIKLVVETTQNCVPTLSYTTIIIIIIITLNRHVLWDDNRRYREER